MRLARVLALGAVLAVIAGPAVRADVLKVNNAVANNLAITFGSYNNTTVGGGSFDVSYLNDEKLDFLYCVDLGHTITIPGTYANALVTTTGVVNGVSVGNASKVAWLLTTYGGIADTAKQTALQAVIWETMTDAVYNMSDGLFKLGSNSAAFNTALTWLEGDITLKGGIGTGNVSQFRWITPNGDSSTRIQGLVTNKVGGSGVVPEAGSLALLLPGLAPLALAMRKRSRRA